MAAKVPTLATFLNTWLADVIEPHTRPNTYTSYESSCRNHIIPALGTMRLDAVRGSHVQTFVNTLAKTLAAGTVAKVYAPLRKACITAVQFGVIARNPCQYVKLPKMEKTASVALDSQQVGILLASLSSHRLAALFKLAIGSGLRRGELCALLWEDMDLVHGTVTVAGNVQRVTGKGLVRGKPKTKSSARTVAIGAALVATLRGWQAYQHAERTALDLPASDYVFTNERGNVLEPGNVSDLFKRLATAAGFPDMHLHDTRHTFTSLLVGAGAHPAVLKDFLGHASITTTMNVYAHVDKTMLDSAAATLDIVFTTPPAVLELTPKDAEPVSEPVNVGNVRVIRH